MKKSLVILLFLSFFQVFSQKKKEVIFSIDKDNFYTSEFIHVLKKNAHLLKKQNRELEKDLQLFINFKLKVKEAYALQLDTLSGYKREIETYDNELTAPYLMDKNSLDSLVKQAYYRMINEIKVSHILVKVAPNATAKDTLVAFMKINETREKIIKGEDFNTVAITTSEDASVAKNKGELPYFGAFRMVFSFEEKAFLTPVNNVSKPFKTRFGYHILKVHDIRKNKKYAKQSFEDLKKGIYKKVKFGEQSRISEKVFFNKIKKKYNFKVFEKAKKELFKKQVFNLNKDSLQDILFKIGAKKIKQEAFVAYYKNRRNRPIEFIYNDFLKQELKTYHKENLRFTEPEYARLIQEYEEGLLLFEFMQQKVWNKANTDSIGIKKYFKKHKKKYKNKYFINVKGEVINDYQTFLDTVLLKELKKKYKVIINANNFNRLLKNKE